MPRNHSRIKKVSYVLQVSCDKPAPMNEKEFLNMVRDTLEDKLSSHTGERPRVSVLKRIEEFISPAKPSNG